MRSRGFNSRSGLPWISATVLLLLLAVGGSSADRSGDADLKRWVEGPIRYIITKEEAKQYHSLESDNDRAFFVERFWLRRDPSPDTLLNEYRELFWRRVKEANDSIQDSPKPGWKTDRGKVYILYGPPSEIQSYPILETDSGPSSGRGLIRWIYQGRPGQRMDMDPITVVPFARDLTGEYRLSYDPKLSSVFFDELAIREKRTQKWESYFTDVGAPPIRDRLSVMLDLGKMQEVPPHEQVLIERVETMESFATTTLAVQIERFRHPLQEGTLASVTVHLPETPPENRPALLARFRPASGDGKEILLGEGSFRFVAAAVGGTIAQGRTTLSPGTWNLLIVAADPITGSTGVHRRSLLTREPTEQLAISDIVFAASLEPLTVAALSSYDEPFHLGSFKVVPRSGNTLARGESLRLFYEIYGGAQPYDLIYRLEGKEDDGRWITLGRPSELADAMGAQGWEVPTGTGWPEGEYRVVIEIRDGAGATLTSMVPFRLEG